MKGIEKVFTAWRKAVRFVWRLPRRTHCVLLPLISDVLPIELQLQKRFVKFMQDIWNSKNEVIRICGKLTFDGSRSTAGKSFTFISSKFNISRVKLMNDNLGTIKSIMKMTQCEYSEEVRSHANIIRELCEVRDGYLTSNLSYTEVDELMECLCTA